LKKQHQASHKPGSVSRSGRDGGHLSGSRVSPTLKRSTRRHRPGTASSASLFDLAPTGVCRAGSVARTAGGLLPHRFTLAFPLTKSFRRSVLCGTFRGLLPLGITQRSALWSPDFPQPGIPLTATAWLA